MSARRFVVIEPLGRGGFGTIYKAQYHGDGDFRKYVALKILNQEVSGIPEVVGRLRDEARILGLLRHRAIVNVDRLSQFSDRWAVVMEYIEGADLARLVEQGPVPVAAALEIAAEVASALHAAWTTRHPDGYEIQLLHRDIKPANVQITAHGEVKVLDFGIARAVFSGREADTKTGVPGTILYMAPERMELIEGPEADVYSLGSMLFEMLTGQRLGRTSPRVERHQAVLRSAEERMMKARISPDLATFVLGMIAYEPADRPKASECVDQAIELRGRARGEPLRIWAARVVPGLVATRPSMPLDELAGKELLEQTTTSPPLIVREPRSAPTLSVIPTASEASSPPPTEPRRGTLWPAALIAVLVAACGGISLGVLWALRGPGEPVVPAATPAPAPEPQAAPEAAPDVAPPALPEAVPAPQPDPATAATTPTPPQQPARKVPRSQQRPSDAGRDDEPPQAVSLAPDPVTVTFTVDGLTSNAPFLEDTTTHRRTPARQGWVYAGTYNVLLECPGYGLTTVRKVTLARSDSPRHFDCESVACSCK